MRITLAQVIAIVGLIGTTRAHATVQVLYYADVTLGTSVVPGAMALLGGGYNLVTSSTQADFNTQLSGGAWDVVIFGEQNDTIFNGSSVQLTSYLAGGGKVIGATWDSTDSSFLAMMGASYFSANPTNIGTNVDPIFNSPYATGSNITTNNPGWGVYGLAYHPVGGAAGLGDAGGGAFGVIRGNGGRTLLNGPLFDSYGSLAHGQKLGANEIVAVATIPEPATGGLLVLGTLFLTARRRK